MQFKSFIVLLLTIWFTSKPIGQDLSHNLQFEQLLWVDFNCNEGILIFLPILDPIVKNTP